MTKQISSHLCYANNSRQNPEVSETNSVDKHARRIGKRENPLLVPIRNLDGNRLERIRRDAHREFNCEGEEAFRRQRIPGNRLERITEEIHLEFNNEGEEAFRRQRFNIPRENQIIQMERQERAWRVFDDIEQIIFNDLVRAANPFRPKARGYTDQNSESDDFIPEVMYARGGVEGDSFLSVGLQTLQLIDRNRDLTPESQDLIRRHLEVAILDAQDFVQMGALYPDGNGRLVHREGNRDDLSLFEELNRIRNAFNTIFPPGGDLNQSVSNLNQSVSSIRPVDLNQSVSSIRPETQVSSLSLQSEHSSFILNDLVEANPFNDDVEPM